MRYRLFGQVKVPLARLKEKETASKLFAKVGEGNFPRSRVDISCKWSSFLRRFRSLFLFHCVSVFSQVCNLFLHFWFFTLFLIARIDWWGSRNAKKVTLNGIRVVVYFLVVSRLQCIFNGICESTRSLIGKQMMSSTSGLRKWIF